MNSALYEGWVTHRRHEPVAHEFRYRLFMMYLDLDELPGVFDGRWLWSSRRPALAWFRRADYFGDARVPLKQAVLDEVETRVGRRPTGPVRVLTHLRTFGLSFNPVSFYYCFDADGVTLDTIVAEITNTPWGERHAYVLPVGSRRRRSYAFRFAKEFHVSPFLDMDCDYDWRFTSPEEALGVHMANLRRGGRLFDASLTLTRRPIDGRSLAVALARHPWITLKVVVAIYWQALRLRVKGCPFYVHPRKRPLLEVDS